MTLQEGLQAGLRVRVLEEPTLERARGSGRRRRSKTPFGFPGLTAEPGRRYRSNPWQEPALGSCHSYDFKPTI